MQKINDIDFFLFYEDSRSIYLKEYLEHYSKTNLIDINGPITNKIKSTNKSRYFILPIRYNENVQNYFDGIKSQLDENDIVFNDRNKNKDDIFIHRQLLDETALVENAVLTAEAIISIATTESNIALLDKKVIITGFGRISKAVAKRLSGFECQIKIIARNNEQIKQAKNLGYLADNIKTDSFVGYDFIINTIPFEIFNENHIIMLDKPALFIETASIKSGIEKSDNFSLHKYVFAPGLPGKFSPKSAAEIIAKSILRNI